jgi:uncharacterized RDD family membrane protein YckC
MRVHPTVENQVESSTVDKGTRIAVELPIAGLGTRSYAFLIDWHVRVLIALGWVSVVMLLFAVYGLDHSINNPTFIYTASIPAGLVYLIYQPLVEIVMRGSSPGKRMAKVRIVATDGHTPTMSALLIRNVFRIVDSLPLCYTVGIVCCLATDKHVRCGDLAAGTLLVHLPEDEERSTADDSLDDDHGSLNPQQIGIIKSLLARWDDLESHSRVELAHRLLAKLEHPVTTDNEGELFIHLQDLLN